MDQDAAAAIAVNAVGTPQAGAAFLDLGADQAMAFEMLANFLGQWLVGRRIGQLNVQRTKQLTGQFTQPVGRQQR